MTLKLKIKNQISNPKTKTKKSKIKTPLNQKPKDHMRTCLPLVEPPYIPNSGSECISSQASSDIKPCPLEQFKGDLF